MNAKRAALLPTVFLSTAILGGVVWALYTHMTGRYAGIVSILIGLLCGGTILIAAGPPRSMWIPLGAALSALLGFLLGKYLDVQFNFVAEVARQLIAEQPGLTKPSAEQIARLQREGATTWELMRQRFAWQDLASVCVAVFVAFRVASSSWVAGWLGVDDGA